MNLKMKMYNIKNKLVLTICFILCFSCQNNRQESLVETLPFYNEASFTPRWIKPDSDSLDSYHRIPEFSFTNQNGELITDQTVKDKIYIVDFFFTSCPGICAQMTSNMRILQNEFINDEEILLLSHSVTPETDSIPILNTYAKQKAIQAHKWHLLTGDRQEIYNLGRKAYFVEEDLGLERNQDEFLHTENFVLIDKNRHIRGIYNGLNKTSIQQLITDIKILKKGG